MRVGDEITYYSQVFVAGHPDGKRITTVKSIKSACVENPLVLDNKEVLPRDQQVMRSKVIVNGRTTEHRGIYRRIGQFRMKKSREASIHEDKAIECDAEGSVWKGGLRRSTRALQR